MDRDTIVIILNNATKTIQSFTHAIHKIKGPSTEQTSIIIKQSYYILLDTVLKHLHTISTKEEIIIMLQEFIHLIKEGKYNDE